MYDLIIRGGLVADGTGTEPRRADVAVTAGRIVAVGTVEGDATRTIDATGRVVAPGFIDVHTHYDAQALWDGMLSPSPLHGVTTVIGGNCGFSVAPLADADVDYLRTLMAVVEGIPMSALEGVDWSWRSFGDYLDRLDGHLGVNAAFLVGHSTLRRLAMGDDAVRREATDDEIATMVALLDAALADGALGLSSGWDNVHTDGDGNPVPSRVASAEEFVRLAEVVGRHPGTALGFFPHMGELPRDRMELMADMSLAAGRPLNWNLLGSMSPVEIYRQQLEACDLARSRGARVVALVLPDYLRLRAGNLLDTIPAFTAVFALDEAGRRAAVADPVTRAGLVAAIEEAAAGDSAALATWDLHEIAEPRSAETVPMAGRSVGEVARERGVDPVDLLLDVIVPERVPLTVMLPTLVPSLGASAEGWHARAEVWNDDRVLLGGSDAGAHLDLMCHANYPTVLLGQSVRARGLLSLGRAVQLMTSIPAGLFGLRDRGVVAEGAYADLVVFDPERVDSGPAIARHDLPGGGERLYAESIGVDHVLVGGTEIVTDGELTGATPGRALRSGRDTDTVGLG